MLAERLFNQGFHEKTENILQIYGYLQESIIMCDSVPMAQLYSTFPQLMKKSRVLGILCKAGHAYSSGHQMP